ncbi:hypothetical protein [Terriglobus sp.]
MDCITLTISADKRIANARAVERMVPSTGVCNIEVFGLVLECR